MYRRLRTRNNRTFTFSILVVAAVSLPVSYLLYPRFVPGVFNLFEQLMGVVAALRGVLS